MRRINSKKNLSALQEAEKNLMEKFHNELMKLPSVEREKLLRRYNTRYVEGMATSYLSDSKFLGEKEARERLWQVIKKNGGDITAMKLILSKAEQIKKSKN